MVKGEKFEERGEVGLGERWGVVQFSDI